jgi:hypothetical protein
MRSLVVSMSVRRHRLISSDYIKTLGCHGRGREFESRRPRHIFKHLQQTQKIIWVCLGPISRQSTFSAAHSTGQQRLLQKEYAFPHQLLNES